MKVCYVTSSFPPFACGVADHVANVSAALARLGIDVTVITSSQIAAPKVPPGVQVILAIDNWNWRGWNRVIRLVVDGRFDCVHFEYPMRYPGPRSRFLRFLPHTLPFALLSWIRFKRIPIVLTVQEYYQSGIFPKLKVQMDALLSTRVLVVTPVDEKLLRRNPLLRRKIRYMPVGTNISLKVSSEASSEAIRKQLGILPDDVLACFFGFLAPNRGFEDLIGAAELVTRAGLRFRVLVIGAVSNPDYISELKSLAESRGVGESFKWVGFVDDSRVADYLNACDLTVQPYLNGANVNRSSLIATVLLGIPAVTTYVEGITPGSFVHEKNTLLVSPNSPEEIAGAILRLCNDARLREVIVEGMRTLATCFSWDSTAAVSAQTYRSISHIS